MYLFDRIDRLGDEKLKHLEAIYFLRCCPANISSLCEELKNPKFSRYFLYFSTPIDED